MTIKSILLKNFQAHKESHLELSDGVNVIIGDSDSGKSAILRALYWLAFGRPSGDSYVRKGVKSPCVVEMETAEGHKIRRVRGKGENYYELNGEQFKAFAKSVPDDVVRALNMNELNFARQMDGPFGFSMSGTEFAQYLNKLVDLDIIGTSLSNINRMVRDVQGEQTKCEQKIAQLEAAVAALDWVKNAEQDVQALERRETKVSRLIRRQTDLVQALGRYAQAKQSVAEMSFVPEALADFKRICDWTQAVTKLSTNVETVDKCHRFYRMAEERVRATAWITRAEKALLELVKRQEALDTEKHRYNTLFSAVDKCKKTQQETDRTGSNLEQFVVYFNRNKPKICPTCGQVWG